MSQMTAVRPPKRTSGSPQWWHLSIHTEGFDVADAIIGELVTPLAAQARLLGAVRWFFQRVEGIPAAQVRIRILAPVETLERLQAFQRALQDQAGGVLSQLTVTQHFSTPASELVFDGFVTEIDTQLEAELATFGGVEGLRLAEEVFELASELAAWGIQRFPKGQNRSAFGALLHFDSARSMMRGPRSGSWPDRRRPSWDYYWDSHLKSCTAGMGPRAANVREAMTAQVAAKMPSIHGLMAATAAEAAVKNWRRRWFRAIDTYLYRADRARVSRSAQQLTVYQAHMLINRLGFTPREEAALGLYARGWHADTGAPELEKHSS